MSSIIVSVSGEETGAELDAVAWEMFCTAHPAEAHAYDPDRFWLYFHKRAPHVSRERMVELLRECAATEDAPCDCGNAVRPGAGGVPC